MSSSGLSHSQTEIRFVSETASTNADMKALALEGACEGLWIRAGRQTAGRGRMGRDWYGETGNLYASTLVRLRNEEPPAATLALVAAVAVHKALANFVGADVLRIKWPNDIMAGPAKLCGMLLERVGDAVIVGIGVNVTEAPELPDRQTQCLRGLGAQGCDAASVLDVIAGYFSETLMTWRTYGIDGVARDWQSRAHAPGTPLVAMLPDGTKVEGRFETLDQSGALVLHMADGSRHIVNAGDVFLI